MEVGVTPGGNKIKMTQSKEYDAPSKISKKEEMPPPRASPFNPAAFNGIAQYFEDV